MKGWQRVGSITLIVVSVLLSFLFLHFHHFLHQAKALGLLGLFLINAISSATLFVSGPAMITVFSGGSIYPPILVALVASLGSSVGEIVGYLFGVSGRSLAYKKLSKKKWFHALSAHFDRFGGLILFVFAFVPNPLFDSMGILAGVFRYSPVKFFLVVAVGRFLRFLLVAYAGSKF